ncbi:MAG: hypothetical protein HYY44_07055 [Deltaproteobacteria bacterium]|nr:hypothetical protein [Deltaproteobacteria bacterium]MBI4373765.1 hypothetical protein [Deltaproteobacteria bacterium]
MRFFSLLLFFSIMAGCTGSEDETDDAGAMSETALAATLSSIQTNIFTPTCATSGCHSGGGPAASLDLSDGSSFSNLVDVASAQDFTQLRVRRSDPDNSYLVKKIEGNAGTQMPRGGSPLSSIEVRAIRDWITNGAENN